MKTEGEIAAGNNTLKFIFGRINQPTTEPKWKLFFQNI
jgi:hypothetical protein